MKLQEWCVELVVAGDLDLPLHEFSERETLYITLFRGSAKQRFVVVKRATKRCNLQRFVLLGVFSKTSSFHSASTKRCKLQRFVVCFTVCFTVVSFCFVVFHRVSPCFHCVSLHSAHFCMVRCNDFRLFIHKPVHCNRWAPRGQAKPSPYYCKKSDITCERSAG